MNLLYVTAAISKHKLAQKAITIEHDPQPTIPRSQIAKYSEKMSICIVLQMVLEIRVDKYYTPLPAYVQ